jgi:hypothetical protein
MPGAKPACKDFGVGFSFLKAGLLILYESLAIAGS